MNVSSTSALQPPPPQPSGNSKPPPWWQGLSPDEQDAELDRIDPANFDSGVKPRMSTGRWNREKRRVRRLREKWMAQILSLRKRCHCHNCREEHRPPFPPYYVVNGISYECWLEMHEPDPELAPELALLRNDRERAGAAFVGHRMSAGRHGIFRAS